MLGGDRERRAEAEAEGLVQARFRRAALALVGDQQDRRLGLAQALGEMLVERRDAGARIEQQQRDVGLADRLLGLLAHAGFERFVEHVFEAGGVDHA